MRTRRSATVLAVALTLVVGACAADSAERATPTTVRVPTTTTMPHRPTGVVDRLVAIGRGRLHLRCTGTGDTTVLLVAGWQIGDDNWGGLEGAVAERTRVCAYARLGTGTSDPAPTTQTFATQAEDLHAVLDAAGEPGPYVLVGHSFGGAEAVTFASRYRDEVAGIMLLDASPTTWPEAVCSVPAYAAGCAMMRDPALDAQHLDVFRAFGEVGAVTSLGDLPLTVVTAAHRQGPLPSAELARLDAIWADGVSRWSSLSPRSTVVRIDDTGHDIHLYRPEVVLDEVLALLRSTATSEGART